MSRIILFNKPFNVLCQFSDKENRDTLANYIEHKNVYPAGRLDYDSEGLLILTDDGQLQYQISHPKKKLPKVYQVQVEGEVSHQDLSPFADGIKLNDGLCKPAKARLIAPPDIWPRNPPIRQRQSIPTSWLEITLTEGRNRQIRRMTAAIGYPTLRLIRVSIGNWELGKLPPGQSVEQKVHSAVNVSRNKRNYSRKR
jgi:23S rRNA pseudouridine2457 synthase